MDLRDFWLLARGLFTRQRPVTRIPERPGWSTDWSRYRLAHSLATGVMGMTVIGLNENFFTETQGCQCELLKLTRSYLREDPS